MKKTTVQEETVSLSLKQVEMAIYGLKIWRQVIVAQTFSELRDGNETPYRETMVEIDLTLEKLDQAKEKF